LAKSTQNLKNTWHTLLSAIQKKKLILFKNTQKPRRGLKNPDLVEKTQAWQRCSAVD
jgi:hypothetical protein